MLEGQLRLGERLAHQQHARRPFARPTHVGDTLESLGGALQALKAQQPGTAAQTMGGHGQRGRIAPVQRVLGRGAGIELNRP